MIWAVFSALALLSSPLQAAEPVTYSRSQLVLKSAQMEEGVLLDVDVRPAGEVFDAGWFEFAGLAEGKGLLLTYPQPTKVTIKPEPYFAPLDILFLNLYGDVAGILPKQSLGALVEPVTMEGDVLAVLYLRGGTADQLRLAPGDQVTHRLFRTRPVIRTKENTPPPKAPMTPEERKALEESLLKRHYEK